MSALEIDTSSRSEQRKFGVVMAVAIVVVTCIHWLLRGHLAVWPLYLAAAFLVLGLIAPRLLQPVFIVWMKFALAINWVVTRVLLSIVFFFLIAPMGVIMRIASEDPLKRRFEPDSPSYWEDAEEQPTDPNRYTNLY